MGLWSAAHGLVALVVASSARRTSAQNGTVLQLSGVCDARNHLNSVLFDKLGLTYNGSPYYKARGRDLYIYYDADCAGGRDGVPRWIMDMDRPRMDQVTDLDGDMACNYLARIDSLDRSQPPHVGTWSMDCGGTWQNVFLALMAAPSDAVEYVPLTRVSTTALPMNTTQRNASQSPMQLRMSGACPPQAYLSTLVFVQQGTTATGAPWYASTALGQYIYYDPRCFGSGSDVGGPSGGLWIIDADAPDPYRREDLNGDGQCAYQARTAGTPAVFPKEATWRMRCGEQWSDVKLQVVSLDSPARASQMSVARSTSQVSTVCAAIATAAVYLHQR